MKNNLLKKFISFSFGTWIGLIIGVISTPIITRLFIPEDFAKASMFNLAINILMIFVMFASDQSYVRFFYEEERDKRKFLLRNSLKIPLVIFFVTSLSILYFRNEVSVFLFGEQHDNIIYLLVASIIIYVINRFSVLVVRMEQLGKIFSILQILLKLLELIFIIALVYLFGNSFENLIYARVATIFIVGLVAIYYGIEHWKFFNKKLETTHTVKDIAKYSSPLVFSLMITWLFQSFDRFAIKEWSTMHEVGIYVAGFRIAALLVIVQSSFTTFWTPVSLEHYEKDPDDTAFFTRINRIITIVMMLIAVGTIMFKDVIALLLGEEYRSASMIMPFLIFMPVMYTISETTQIGINFKKKVKWHLVISIVAAIFNLAGNYFLVPIYGGKGAAISTGLSYIVFFSLRTLFSLRYYKVNYHLKQFYSYTLLIVIYALYNTFIENWLVSGIMGTIIASIILLTNLNFIIDNLTNVKLYLLRK